MSAYPVTSRGSFVFLLAAALFAPRLQAEVEVFTGQPTNANQEYLLAAWNFNDAETLVQQLAVSHGSGTLTSNWDPAAFSNFGGTGINAFNADGAGRDLGLRNGPDLSNEGRHLTFRIAMDGFNRLFLSYAARRSSSGFTEHDWSWSIDGENFVPHKTVLPAGNYELRTVDFESVGELENAADVYLRLTVRGLPESPSATGNNRLDNLQIRARAAEGTAGPGAVTIQNATESSPYAGTGVFNPGEEQTLELLIRGTGPEVIETVSLVRPVDWSAWSAEQVQISGAGLNGAELTVAGDRIEIRNAAITETASGSVRIRDWLMPGIEELSGWGRVPFDVETASAAEAPAPVSPRPEAMLVIPIERLRATDASGNPAALGERLAISGVATVASGRFSVLEFSVFVQDETAGVALYAESLSEIWKPVSAGNAYTAVGTVELHRGLTRLRLADAMDLFDLGPDVMPSPKVLTIDQLLAAPEAFEGMLVRVPRVSKSAESEDWPEPGLSGTIAVADDTGASSLAVFLNRFTDVAYQPAPDFPVDLVGIFSQFSDVSGNSDDGYQLIPRSRADILPPSEIVAGFEAWREEFFGEGEHSGAEADPDGDGVINLLEYAFGGNPHEPSRAVLPRVSLVDGIAEIVFRRVRVATDLIYEVEASEDLDVWETVWSSAEFPFDGNEAVLEERVTDVSATEGFSRRFLRVRVSRAEGSL